MLTAFHGVNVVIHYHGNTMTYKKRYTNVNIVLAEKLISVEYEKNADIYNIASVAYINIQDTSNDS